MDKLLSVCTDVVWTTVLPKKDVVWFISFVNNVSVSDNKRSHRGPYRRQKGSKMFCVS